MSAIQRIGILGATSQISKDLIVSFSNDKSRSLHLFARRPGEVGKWLDSVGLKGRFLIDDFESFGKHHFDAVINFIGVGDPARSTKMGASIFDVTLQYDELALNYVRRHPECRYIFLSSGAAYCSDFEVPVDVDTEAKINLNNLYPHNWYAIAKLSAEARHRSLSDLPIVDVRVFNYFSHTQDMRGRYLMTDIVRSIRDNKILKASPDYVVRDYIGPNDFYLLICSVLNSPPRNDVVDCYSNEPIDKPSLLHAMQEEFGLCYETDGDEIAVNATGKKPHYYSLNRSAEKFGYKPTMTSLELLKSEVKMFFACAAKGNGIETL